MIPPTLSIVIPAYQASHHLRTLPARLAAIRERQLPIDVIIVISGRDHELSIALEDLANELPSATVITTDEALTPGLARNQGLERARARYVAFLDVDDYYDLPALLVLVQEMSESGAVVGIGSYRIRSARDLTTTQDVILEGDYERVLQLLHKYAAVWRYAFDRRWLNETGVRFSRLPLGEDLLFLIDIDKHRPTVHTSRRIHYTYVIDQPNQSSGFKAPSAHRRSFLEELARRAAEPNCPKDLQRILAKWFLQSWGVGVRNAARSGRVLDPGGFNIWLEAGAPGRSLVLAVPRAIRLCQL